MKTKTIKRYSFAMASVMFLTNAMPLLTFAVPTKDSLGSLDMNDNGDTVGVDFTQGQTTHYHEEITNEVTENTTVYVSQASSFGVIIPKTIILDGKTKNATYEVSVTGNIGGQESIEVVPEDSFLMKQQGKNDIDAIVTQDKTSWIYNEFETKGNGTIVAEDMTAGSWNGQFNFNIFLNEAEPMVIAIDENGTDLNASATFILGSQKDTLLNELVDSGQIASKSEVSTLINVDTDDFENKATATFNVSSFANVGDKIAIYHYDETTSEWEYIATCEVNDEYKITANFDSFSPVAFQVIGGEHTHTHKLVQTINATCESKGAYVYECACGDRYETPIEALGHSFNTKEVSETYLATASDCENAATYYFKCDRCDAKGSETYVNGSANGHQFSDWNTTIEPTCTTKGSEERSCTVCGKVETQDKDALGHDFASEYTTDKEPTCTQEGSKSQHCSRCSATQNVTSIEATGHANVKGGTEQVHESCSVCGTILSSIHNITSKVTIQPTCETKGTTQYSCACGYSYTKQDIDALGHKEVNGGTSEIHTKCSVCNKTLSSTHSITSKVTTQPTCTVKGTTTYTCACGYSYTKQDVDALGHSFNTKEVSATYLASASDCENAATYYYKCDRCTTKGTQTFVNGSANGHQFSSWITTKEPTCTTKGSEQRTCSICRKVETQDIVALGHNFASEYTIDKAATCTVAGSKSQHCSRCSATQNVTVIPATGHTNVNGGTSDIHTKCSVCGVTTSSTHTYTSKVTIQPTCTVKGTTKYTCACGYSYTKQDVAVLGHNFASEYTIDKAATCTVAGSKSQHCSRCSATQNVTIIPATGHTNVNGGTSAIHTKCSVCGVTTSSTHTYTSKVTTQPTCTVKGTTTYTCACGYSYTKQDVAVLGHNLVAGECSRCDYIEAGLYDTNGIMIASWEDSGIDVEKSYSTDYKTNTKSPHYVVKNKYPTTTKIIIPNGITKIGKNAFYSLNVNVVIPNSVTSISSSYNVAHITYSGNASGSPWGALCVNGYIEDNFIYLDKTKTTVCGYLGEPNNNLTIPNSVTSIEKYAFYNRINLINVTLPNNLTTIGECAFRECINLTTINIPNNITNIDSCAFYDCVSLNVTIPSTITNIGSFAFNYVPNINYEGTNSNAPFGALCVNGYIENNFVYLDKTKTTLCGYIGKISNNVTIPNSVINIEHHAFYYRPNIINVTISNNVSIINDSVFEQCNNMTTIIIPNNVTYLGEYIFRNCANLNNIFIPDSVTYIGSCAFYECTSLTNITLSNNIKYINNDTFRGCTSLKEITIPNNVKRIYAQAFANCTNLTSITMSNNLISIERASFTNCTSLTNISIPNNVTTIGNSAFYNCKSLTSITIPNGVTTIGSDTFNGCSSLTNITIPNNITSIGSTAFASCTNLTNITIPNSVTTIGTSAFYNVPHITYSGTATGSPWGAKSIN